MHRVLVAEHGSRCVGSFALWLVDLRGPRIKPVSPGPLKKSLHWFFSFFPFWLHLVACRILGPYQIPVACGIFLDQGLNLHPLQCQCRVLITGWPGMSSVLVLSVQA